MAAKDLSELVIMPGQDYIDICNAVRAKTGQVNDLVSGELPQAINSIQSNSGTDTSDGTAVENDIAYGKIAYVNGEQIIGNIPCEPYIDVNANIDWDTKNNKLTLYSYPEERVIIGTERTYIEDGEEYEDIDYTELSCSGQSLGNATIDDVKQGVTFTSQNGLKLIGNLQLESSGIPSNFIAYNTGSRIFSSDSSATTGLRHELEQKPNFYCIYAKTDQVLEDEYLTSAIGIQLFGSGQVSCNYNINGENTSMTSTFYTNTNYFNLQNASLKYKAGITYEWMVGVI